jgi:hypothetical protein
VSECWYKYIETASEGHDQLLLIRAITNSQVYMGRQLRERGTFGNTLREHADLVRFLCTKDLGWMAELVLREELASPEKLLVDDVLIHSAGKSTKVFAVLLPWWRPHGQMGIQRVTSAAAGSSPDVMHLLLETKGDEVHITPEIVVAAAGNLKSGKQVMQLLLERKGEEVQVTPEVVIAAAKNSGRGKEVMQLLLPAIVCLFVCLIQSGYSRLPYEPSLESDLTYKRDSLPSLMNESDPSLWLPTQPLADRSTCLSFLKTG